MTPMQYVGIFIAICVFSTPTVHQDRLLAQSSDFAAEEVCKELGCDDMDLAIIKEIEKLRVKRKRSADLPACPIDPFMWYNLSCA